MDADEYINGLIGPAAAKACHADSAPQLPASIMIAQAIKECGFDESNWGGWNVFNIAYSSSIATAGHYYGGGRDWCAFNNIEEACQGYIKNMKGGYYDEAIALLKPKIEDDTPEDKLNYFKTLLPIYAPPSENNDEQYLSDVIGFINTYDLFKFDDPKSAGMKVDDALAKKVGASIGKGGGNGPGNKSAASSDGGFEVRGTMVIKLPKNKTFAEPIYPDFVTINDTVPAWVLDAMNSVKGEETKDHAGEIIKDGDAKETAPNGMHYSEADIKSLMDNNKGMTREAAIAQLAKTDKYTRRVKYNGDGTFTIIGDDKAPTGTTTKDNSQDKATWVPNDNNNNGSGPKTNTGTSSGDNKNTTGGTDNNGGQQQPGSGASTGSSSGSESGAGSPGTANHSGNDSSSGQ